MSLVSTEEFLRKGHQVDLDMFNLDSAIFGLNQEGAVPSADAMTWQATYSEWKHYFDENIKDVPIMPWQSTEDLDKWLTRIDGWRVKLTKWALPSSGRARAIVNALPDSPAAIEHRENPPTGMPAWVALTFGLAFLTAVGYSLGQAARLGAVARGGK